MFAENDHFLKIGGSIIKIMNDLAKEVETEKMKVSFVCMKWLTSVCEIYGNFAGRIGTV